MQILHLGRLLSLENVLVVLYVDFTHVRWPLSIGEGAPDFLKEGFLLNGLLGLKLGYVSLNPTVLELCALKFLGPQCTSNPLEEKHEL